ncbi:uncharacterized protein PSFLO_03986 [Pseudozyma flocculosa]|uniref:Uncharacterized protein n=1 Tax=Pseudozyma flocculosa TaxID=84751 RepID=A0A5C3F215_9BASI|nr:uncharacterized protein PSFLO_03986 [Pseudozyma flocculosa]
MPAITGPASKVRPDAPRPAISSRPGEHLLVFWRQRRFSDDGPCDASHNGPRAAKGNLHLIDAQPGRTSQARLPGGERARCLGKAIDVDQRRALPVPASSSRQPHRAEVPAQPRLAPALSAPAAMGMSRLFDHQTGRAQHAHAELALALRQALRPGQVWGSPSSRPKSAHVDSGGGSGSNEQRATRTTTMIFEARQPRPAFESLPVGWVGWLGSPPVGRSALSFA